MTITVCSSPEQEAFIRGTEPPNVRDKFPVGIHIDSECVYIVENEKCLVFRVWRKSHKIRDAIKHRRI